MLLYFTVAVVRIQFGIFDGGGVAVLFSVTCVLSSNFFVCYSCVRATLYFGKQVSNYYTGLSLAVQTSVLMEFECERDFSYDVIVTTETSRFPLSFLFAVFHSKFNLKSSCNHLFFFSLLKAKKPSCKRNKQEKTFGLFSSRTDSHLSPQKTAYQSVRWTK